jgi:hypothetical protein
LNKQGRDVKKVFFIVLILSASLFGRIRIKPENHIVKQSESPIEITRYKAAFSRDDYGINHSARYLTHGDRLIVAVRFGFVSFNIWNEFIDKSGGIAIKDIAPTTGKVSTDNGTWNFRCRGEGEFHVGFVYVERVRFENGEFWECDKEAITAQMQEFEENFSIENLEDSKDDE